MGKVTGKIILYTTVRLSNNIASYKVWVVAVLSETLALLRYVISCAKLSGESYNIVLKYRRRSARNSTGIVRRRV